ncbi:MAG: peptidase [Caldithrix sp.]|nr:peptidase [Caldithrix sp.]
MPFFLFDPTMILLVPALILAFWAQMRVKKTYRKFQKISASGNVTGYKVAKHILNQNGLSSVEVNAVKGELSDHYDPRKRTVNLSEANYRGNSLAAIAVAAHEVGHAIQHHTEYTPLKLRHAILPVTSFASWAAFPLFFIGFLFSIPGLLQAGIIFFAAVVAFHLVTLPVEFNASSRAIAQLNGMGVLMNQELSGARKVLNAAAFTYVASATMALLQLVRLILLSQSE